MIIYMYMVCALLTPRLLLSRMFIFLLFLFVTLLPYFGECTLMERSGLACLVYRATVWATERRED